MRRRHGVTLIELLVVIGIITALATMIVALAPRFGERQRATRGASQLQGWLNVAKQRAVRDRRPVGIRMPYQSNSSYVTTLQYVEVPDESIGGTVTVPYPVSGAPNYSVIQLTTTANFTPGTLNALLQPGDVILIPGPAYAPRRITNVVGPATSGGSFTYQVTLDQPLAATPSTTSAYRVSRKARPIMGEAVLQMPKDIAIDISNNATKTAPPTWYRMFPATANTGGTSPFDILFSPAGQVVGAEGNLGSRICLWVRDVSLGDPGPTLMPPGYNTLITIYTRTGHVTAHEVAANDPNTGQSLLMPSTSWNPFYFTQDGISSGY